VHVAEKGKDPRRASLVAFGGAGPIHAHAVALALKMREVICPLRAGVASALGFLTAPIAFDFAQSLAQPLTSVTPSDLRDVVGTMEGRGYDTLREAGIAHERVAFTRSADMRYVGQGHEIEVPLPAGEIDEAYIRSLPSLFYEAYRSLYGQAHEDVPIEFVTCRVTASGPAPSLQLPKTDGGNPDLSRARKGSRQVYFKETGGFVDAEVYDRYQLPVWTSLPGPAVVEETESTVIVPPQMTALVDAYGNLLLRVV
jgi:N-methylhydantoinase A